jgi:leucine dehydrogenase
MLKITEITPEGHPEFDSHERVVRIIDEAAGLHAMIAVHNTNLGPSLGGCRIRAYGSEDEALTDVLRLARGMTYKSALARLPLGGGKSVILANPKTDKSDALFHAFGDAIQSLKGIYITAEDVGSNEQDMIRISERTSYVCGLPVAVGTPGGNPSPFTAYGVFCGIRASLQPGLKRSDMQGLSVAIQGLGAVGYSLAQQLHQAGAVLYVADVDQGRLQQAQNEMPDRLNVVATDRIHSQDVDVFAPCALGAVLNDTTIPELRARIIAGAANNQLAHPVHDAMLKEKGILYAPDYVVNAGGVTAVGYEYFRRNHIQPFVHGMSANDLTAHVEQIGSRVGEIYELAKTRQTGTGTAADDLARRTVAVRG